MHAAAADRKSSRPASAPPLALAALLVANVALAFGPLFVRLSDVGPVAAAFWRLALAVPLIALLAVAATRGRTMPALPARTWWLLAAAGVAFAGDLGAWHVGILGTTLANATLFGNSATFIFPLYGFLVARRWPSRTQGAALALAAAGAGLLLGRSYQLDPGHLVGDLLCLLAGVLYAVYFALMADVRRATAPLPALALSSAAGLAPLLLFAWWLGERIVPGDWTPLVALALASQVIGQGCMIYALGKLSPLVIGLALLIQPVVAAAIGWSVFGERLAAADLVGVAMVAAALVLVRRDPDPARTAR
ncbi:DMT family transporter [Sphingomonas corticis]|jgi:drug/metabolite transporter (DMT)-like permease|uniref:DMT family transporter n=1 Tax=Sphingomonas corticis TaxID=2722791 RepID=A0ABX1CI31_9SPHN|nr:DMT family transporter [Sphingomonas corticis]NJR77659.1 DMT family transporter [Sphingomonas corticis]